MFENMLTIGISVFLPTYGGGVSAQDEEAGRNREWSFGWWMESPERIIH